MRVTGGTLRGRMLESSTGLETRPTADRVRQAILNVLAHRSWNGVDFFQECVVLDAFSGTGALGIEALARGAKKAFFFDTSVRARACTQRNLEVLELRDRAVVLPVDATKPPKATQAATLVFLDPPYGKGLATCAVSELERNGWIAEKAVLVVEAAKKESLSFPQAFTCLLTREYGATAVHFLSRAEAT